MGKAFKCDRCGRYEDDEPVAGVTFTLPTPVAVASGSSSRRTEARELCARCLAGLQEWLDYHKEPQDGA